MSLMTFVMNQLPVSSHTAIALDARRVCARQCVCEESEGLNVV